MPIYIYEHPTTGEQKEVIQRMTETHEYAEYGIKWKRVFALPQAQIDALDNVNPFDKDAFKRKTGKMYITQGDLWDASKALSEKRERIMGKDPVKEATAKDYTKRTTKPHPLY